MAKKKVEVVELTPEELADAVNKKYGAGTMTMASDPQHRIRKIPTGSLAIDELLAGGVARGRHTELYGSPSVGKTTLAYSILASAQRLGGRGAYIDTEGTFHPEFAAHIGVNIDELAYHRQVHGPRCIDVAELLLRSRQYDAIVIDSIASLLPLPELESDMETSSYGMEQAKMMSKALRKLTAANRNTAIIWINQTRDNIGVTFGSKSTTSGGRAMPFYGATRLEMVRVETLTREGEGVDPDTGEIKKKSRVPYGHRIKVKAVKEKTGARPMAETSLVFDYEQGRFDHLEDLILLGREYGFIEKKNNTWWVDDYPKKKSTYKKNFKKFLGKNPNIAAELEEWIRNSFEPDEEDSSMEEA